MSVTERQRTRENCFHLLTAVDNVTSTDGNLTSNHRPAAGKKSTNVRGIGRSAHRRCAKTQNLWLVPLIYTHGQGKSWQRVVGAFNRYFTVWSRFGIGYLRFGPIYIDLVLFGNQSDLATVLNIMDII